ncbi:translation initiation factor IF-2, partial [Reticulomyxa filosa]
ECLEQMLPPKQEAVFCGQGTVKQVFTVTSKETQSMVKIAGIFVDRGKFYANGHYRIKRQGKIVYEQVGATELKHFAAQVDQVQGGDECGVKLDFEDWKVNDIVECMEFRQEKKKIDTPQFELDSELQSSLQSATPEKHLDAALGE